MDTSATKTELRGDLRAQHRQVAHLNTGAKDGINPNAPFAWGVIVRDSIVYVSDMQSGLWILRLKRR